MNVFGATWACWGISVFLLIVVAVLVHRRQATSLFPWFYAMVLFEIPYSAHEILVPSLTVLNFTASDWTFEILKALLAFLSLREAYQRLFEFSSDQMSNSAFRWVIITAIGIAIAMSYAESHPASMPRHSMLVILQRTIACALALSSVILLIAVRVTGLFPRHYAFGVVAGIGLEFSMVATSEFAIEALRLSASAMIVMHQVCILAAAGAWTLFFIERPWTSSLDPKLLRDVQRWRDTIARSSSDNEPDPGD